MEKLRRVLLWEVIRYEPHLLFLFNCLSKSMHDSLSSDLTYVYFFLEDYFSQENVRSLNWNEACDLVRDLLPSTPFLWFFTKEMIYRYDVRNLNLQKFTQDLPSAMEHVAVANISNKKIFYSGGF